MERIWRILCVVNLWVVSFVGPAAAQIDQTQVSDAIRRGVDFLKREQNPRGRWSEYIHQPGGVSSLATLALLNAGVPKDDPTIQKALGALRRIKPSKTYVVSLQAMALAAAEPKRDLVMIRRNATWLENSQIKSGAMAGSWAYGDTGKGDNSNSQFAILALHEAERVGVEIKEETWRLALDYWQRAQNDDGSWGYVPQDGGGAWGGTGSMTCAGIAAVVIASGKLNAGDAGVVGGRVLCCGTKEEDRTLQQALDWLGRNFSAERNPGNRQFGQNWYYYYLYGVERAGRMTARRFLGEHDWYRAGADALLQKQDALSGSWTGMEHAENHPHIATSMALLFLSKGRRPVLLGKLKYGTDEGWNNHRSDAANLTAYTERKWEMDLTWQVVDMEAARVEDLLQAPVLFISGRSSLELSAAEKRNLRAYIDRGGFIFAEACCDGKGFDQAFRALMEDVFPEPEYQLGLIPPEHPVWHAEETVDPEHLRPLWGMDYGCRTSVVYCPEDLSCYWELSRSGREKIYPDDVKRQIEAANAIGVNVLTYATGRQPKYKDVALAHARQGDAFEGPERGTVAVARLLHPGGCNAAPGALANLLRAARHELNLPVRTEATALGLSDPQLFEHHVIFMSGRHAFQLTAQERKRLKTFVERGGTLFADSICSNPAFAESFRREIRTIFPEQSLERIPAEHPMLTDAFGGFDVTVVSRRQSANRGGDQPIRARVRRAEPDLEGVQLGERYAVIFSPHDISCALQRHASLECDGYLRDDAAKLGLNVLLYALH